MAKAKTVKTTVSKKEKKEQAVVLTEKEVKGQTTNRKTKNQESDIKTLVGCAAIRKRPGMYIGELGQRGVFRLFSEVLANAVDLFTEGAIKNVLISLNEKTSQIQIVDDGYGMPLGKVEDIMTKTHTSGKFENTGFSFGMNGVGLKAVNALSESTVVIVKRDGYKHKQEFSKGKPITKLERLEKTKETGTTILFIPDKTIMGEIEIETQAFIDFIEVISYLNKNLKITLHVIRKTGNDINRVFLSKNGLLDYINKEEKHPLLTKHIEFTDKKEDRELVAYINYSTKNDYENVFSFVNGMKTVQHGTHIQGFRMAITQVLNKYIQDNNLISKKEGKLEITGDDVREGLTVVLELKWVEPLFDSQTKDNLTTKEAMGYVKKVIADQLTEWLVKNKNIAKTICTKVISNAKGRAAAKRAKANVIKKDGGFTSISNASKYSKCSCTDPTKTEVFLVEGRVALVKCL